MFIYVKKTRQQQQTTKTTTTLEHVNAMTHNEGQFTKMATTTATAASPPAAKPRLAFARR